MEHNSPAHSATLAHVMMSGGWLILCSLRQTCHLLGKQAFWCKATTETAEPTNKALSSYSSAAVYLFQ